MQPLSFLDVTQSQDNLADTAWQEALTWKEALHVQVDDSEHRPLSFAYRLTTDDVRKVFSRYGTIAAVAVNRESANARVLFKFPYEADDAQRALDGQPLTGLTDAYLTFQLRWDDNTPCWSAQYVKEYKLPHSLWTTLAILSAP